MKYQSQTAEGRKMLIKDLENVIKEENLQGANICNTTSLLPDQVVITEEEGKWKVYNTDERASLIGVVSYFDSEADACEDFIKKLRLRKRMLELQKEIWKKRNNSLNPKSCEKGQTNRGLIGKIKKLIGKRE